jgi:hypothetical protein
MDKNNIKKENVKILDVFDVENIRDYNLAFKRINSRYATRIRQIRLDKIAGKEKEIENNKELTPINYKCCSEK